MKNKVLQLIEENEPLSLNNWFDTFKPACEENEEVELFFNSPKEARVYIFSNRATLGLDYLKTEDDLNMENHVWTRLSEDSGKLILRNGYAGCNVIDYCVARIPWGTENIDENKKIYLEVQFDFED